MCEPVSAILSTDLARLFTGALVLCSLTQVLHPLVLRQEVLLLGHFLSIRPLMERLPVWTGCYLMGLRLLL